MLGIQASRCLGVLGAWAVVLKPGARSSETRYEESAPGPGSYAFWPCYSGSRCFMGISVGLALVEGLLAAGWATLLKAGSVRGTGRQGKRLGRRLDGRRGARRLLNHPQKTSVERLLEPGLGRLHCPRTGM